MTIHSTDGTVFAALVQELSSRYPVTERYYAADVRLVEQGQAIDKVQLLISGAVKLSFVDERGREFILSLHSAPWVAGAAGVIVDAPSPVTATTLTGCRVRHFSAADLKIELRSSVTLSSYLCRSLARENLDQTIAMMEAGYRDTRSRLIKFLARLHSVVAVAPADPSQKADGLLKKHEIAKLLAVTPEHLSRLLRSLQREGLVRFEKRRIILRDTRGVTRV